MPGGTPPLTTSWRTILPAGAPGLRGDGGPLDRRGDAGPLAVSRNVDLAEGDRVVEPRGVRSVTRAPLMQVPFELPRSLTSTPSAPTVSSAWRREMVGS